MDARRSGQARRAAKGATRARILAAAERLFAERGFREVTMPQIAAASGLTAGAIYRHFQGKVELFFEVIRGAVAASSMGAGESSSSVGENVAAMTGRDRRRLRQMAVVVHAAARRDARVRRLLRAALDADVARLSAASGAAEPDLAATAVLVFVMGLMHMETLIPGLIGEPRWRAFVAHHVNTLIGAR